MEDSSKAGGEGQSVGLQIMGRIRARLEEEASRLLVESTRMKRGAEQMKALSEQLSARATVINELANSLGDTATMAKSVRFLCEDEEGEGGCEA